MKINTIEELHNYRIELNKTQTSEFATDVNLFGVYTKLNKPVITFVKLSKKFLYDNNCNKHNFNKHSLLLFTSKTEAWRYFTLSLKEKHFKLEDFYKREKDLLNKAIEIYNTHYKDCPEYFI